MKNEEKILFKKLCNFKSKEFDEGLLEYATPHVLGQLFFNRMQSIAYGTLKKHGLLGKVNREFRNSLKMAYEQNSVKNKSYFNCVQYVIDTLGYFGDYALLKGALLCRFYPSGFRTSNDIDLLVLPENVTKIGSLLSDAGFRQGNVRNDVFVPATRKEIIESRMTRGETVPYIKEVDLPGLKFLEIDINFSLDYKNGDTDAISKMMREKTLSTIDRMDIPTLDERDFFIHLCGHLYKEATTLPWVEMKRDMTLYKYGDIYLLLDDMRPDDICAIFDRARELGMEKSCAFAVLHTCALFEVENQKAIDAANEVLRDDEDFIHTVIYPKEKKTFIYTEKNIEDRFFCEDRQSLLKEVKNNGET